MKKNFYIAIFCGIQVCIVIWLKRAPSFGHVKLFFASIEALVCTLIGLLYLKNISPQLPPEKPAPPQTAILPSPDIQKKLDTALQEHSEHMRLAQVELAKVQESLQKEHEKNELLQKQISEVEKRISSSGDSKKLYSQTLREVSEEVLKLCTQLDQDRKTHAVEIRALLGKEGKTEKLSPLPIGLGLTPPSLSPHATVLTLLLQCQQGIENPETSSWPHAKHSHLMRRTFFDRLQQISRSPIAAFSFTQPSELFVSPKFPELLTSKEIAQISETHAPAFKQLSLFEPYPLKTPKGTYVAFRAALQNLEDLVLLAPTPQNADTTNKDSTTAVLTPSP